MFCGATKAAEVCKTPPAHGTIDKPRNNQEAGSATASAQLMANKLEGENNLTNRGRGRPKGSQNKTTKAAKEAIMFAAEGLGGGERLVEWAKEDPVNEKAFWTQIYPKLLPLEVNATGSFTVTLPKDAAKL